MLILQRDVWPDSPLLEHGPDLIGAYLQPDELGLSPDLVSDLETWHADADNPLWRAIIDDTDPTRLGPLPKDYQPDPVHAVAGFRLTARLQRELGETWTVWHTSCHSFYTTSGRQPKSAQTLLLRALNGDPAASILDLTTGRREIRPAATLGATPPTIAALALWRRAATTSSNAETRAEGADVAALLQHDLGLTAEIRYTTSDDPT